MHCQNKIILLFILVSWHFAVWSQTSDSDYVKGIQQQQTYMQQPVKAESFDKKEWTDLKKKLKIKEYQPVKKKEKKPSKNLPQLNISPTWSLIIKWTLFAIIIGALLFLVLRVLGINPFNRKADKNKILISLEELEENLDTASIDPHLYAAIKAKDFKLAIRLYYLMIIQKLALKEKIIWKKYKTNKHYLNEMRSKDAYPEFKKLTLIYEKCWFGEDELSETGYNTINSDFVNFLQNIK
jgi:hypothetical protein